jgi:hypothetical protein
MSDKYQALRDALKAGPTGGNWRKPFAAEVRIGNRRLCYVTAAESLAIGDGVERANINAAYIAAANPATITALLADLDAAVSMLEKVAEWGPFPRVPDVYSDEPGATIGYGLAYGSNGERDYIRGEVRATLSQIKAAGREQA